MKVEASLNNLRITPRKVRMIAYSLRGIGAQEALVQLQKQVKKSALPLAKLLKSAMANAENNFGISRDNLYVADVVVGDGQRLKRWMPRAHGRATAIVRRMAHVRVVLGEIREGGSAKVAKRAEKVEEESVEAKPEKKSAPKRSVATRKPAASKISQKKGPAVAAKKVFQRKSV
jgi:large subunit ribosomal protein L22